jgi:hypothetical protein
MKGIIENERMKGIAKDDEKRKDHKKKKESQRIMKNKITRMIKNER